MEELKFDLDRAPGSNRSRAPLFLSFPTSAKVSYCGRECQAAHWKGGHKQACSAAPTLVLPTPAGKNTCLLCFDALNLGALTFLPCKHAVHTACLDSMASYAQPKCCPTCRPADESPAAAAGAELYDAARILVHFSFKVQRGKMAWSKIVPADRTQVDAVLKLWRRTAAAGAGAGASGGEGAAADAMQCLAVTYEHGRGVERDFDTAIKWYQKAAEAGQPVAQVAAVALALFSPFSSLLRASQEPFVLQPFVSSRGS